MANHERLPEGNHRIDPLLKMDVVIEMGLNEYNIRLGDAIEREEILDSPDIEQVDKELAALGIDPTETCFNVLLAAETSRHRVGEKDNLLSSGILASIRIRDED